VPRPKLLFEAQAQIAESIGESGPRVFVIEVVRHPKPKLGFVSDSESHRCLGEIEAPLATAASLLISVLKLHASTGDDNTRIRDLRAIRGNRALRIGTASLSLRLQREASRHY
jgi:hypothetical protein